MSFRRSRKEERCLWSTWLQMHRDTLARIGLPIEHFQDRSNWWYFLDHAYTEQFTIDWLNNEQLRWLYEFLSEHGDREDHCSQLFYLLKHRFEPEASA